MMRETQSTWQTEHSIETDAAPEVVWAIFREVPSWKSWNSGIETIEVEGPFADGTWFTMKPPGQEAFRSKLVDVRENEGFTDETCVGHLVVRVAHRIERLASGRTRVTYAVDARGPEASEIGPAISADFPEVLASLAALAAEKSS
ncbi:hypothetical protein AKJ09_10365 [Labilithrix luteola]|uniref:Polyketide cyclase/dehydrase n=1 Tax=Labilithrix luteola TaxID=1391654 RepID=A0A0K1QDF5_9BACT|nr:SRPBCC family protein [Labilithrix luteola]AKV03702.1 hypothetical protein AKJ09_10365 [Labilithrix luteola]